MLPPWWCVCFFSPSKWFYLLFKNPPASSRLSPGQLAKDGGGCWPWNLFSQSTCQSCRSDQSVGSSRPPPTVHKCMHVPFCPWLRLVRLWTHGRAVAKGSSAPYPAPSRYLSSGRSLASDCSVSPRKRVHPPRVASFWHGQDGRRRSINRASDPGVRADWWEGPGSLGGEYDASVASESSKDTCILLRAFNCNGYRYGCNYYFDF